MESMGPIPTSLSEFPPEYVAHDTGSSVIATSIAMTAATVVIVAGRFVIRSRMSIGLGKDDWLILAVVPLMIGFMVATIFAVQKGGAGRHLGVNMVLGMERIEQVYLYLYIGEYLYFTMVALIKASILAMYYRLFPTRSMRWGVLILGGSVLLWWVAIILVTIFQCQPVSNAYKPFVTTGSCIAKEEFFFGNSLPNVLQDVFIILLPAHEVWRLQVSRRQKVAILGVFVLGFVVVIIGCLRLKSLLDLVHSDDFTDAIAIAWIWTIAEPFTGIIAACLPTFRPLLGFLFGRAFATKHSSKGNTPGAGGNSDLNGRTLITIGGGNGKGGSSRVGFNSSKNSSTLRSFTQLEDEDDYETEDRKYSPVGLWPKGYTAEREVTAYGPAGRDPSIMSDEIPLDSIGVKRDVRWTENNRLSVSLSRPMR